MPVARTEGGAGGARRSGWPAGRGGLRVRGRPVGGDDARPAGRRRDPLRPHRGRHRPPPLAGDRRRHQPLLGRAQQGQAIAAGGRAVRGRPPAGERADRRARPGGGHLPHELPRRRLAGLRGAARPSRGSHHARHLRQSRRHHGGGLHGELRRGVPDGDRSRTGRRRRGRRGPPAGEPRPAGLGRDLRADGRAGTAGRRAPPQPDRGGAVRLPGPVGRGAGHRRRAGPRRRGAGPRHRAHPDRQRPLRGPRPGLPLRGRPAGHRGGDQPQAVAGAVLRLRDDRCDGGAGRRDGPGSRPPGG